MLASVYSHQSLDINTKRSMGVQNTYSDIAKPTKIALEVTYPVRREFLRHPSCISSPESCSDSFRLSVSPGIMLL